MSDEKKLVSLSLSYCVLAIHNGLVGIDDVEKIVAGTNFANVEQVINSSYSEYDWSKFRDEAAEIVTKLWNEGRIEQPRRDGTLGAEYPDGHNIAGGCWLDVKEGKQFNINANGERVYSEELGEGVDLILQRERKLEAEQLTNNLGIKRNSGGRSPG